MHNGKYREKAKSIGSVEVIIFLFSAICLIFIFPVVSFGDSALNDLSSTDGFYPYLSTNYSYVSILENYFLSALSLIEESGGFSLIDYQKISLNGSSYFSVNWYFNGFTVNHPLFGGASAILFSPFLISDIFLQYNDTISSQGNGLGINIIPKTNGEKFIAVDFLATFGIDGYQFSVGPFFFDMVNSWNIPTFLLGLHPLQKESLPASTRRYSVFQYQVNLFASELTPEIQFLNIYSLLGRRQFNSFYYQSDNDHAYLEDYYSVQIMSEINVNQYFTPLLILEYRYQSNLFAEYNYQEEQTATNTYFYAGLNQSGISSLYSIDFSYNKIKHNNLEFDLEIYDPDGEGLLPFYPEGEYFTLSTNGEIIKNAYYLSYELLNIYYLSDQDNWMNPITYLGNPYGSAVHNSSDSLFFISNMRAGYSLDTKLLPWLSVLFDSSLLVQCFLNETLTNNLFLVDVDFSVQLRFLDGFPLQPFISLYKKPVLLDFDMVKKLHPDYMNTLYYNGAQLYDSQGGGYLSIDENIKNPDIYGLSIGFSWQVNDSWKIQFQGLGQIYSQTFWIATAGDVLDYFYPETEDNGQIVYYYLPGETQYLLTNYSLDETIYHVAAQLEIQGGEDDVWFFNLGVEAHQTMGITAFGNGLITNDPLYFDFSMANPNTATSTVDDSAYGRLDNDRAYLIKLNFGFLIFKGFWASFLIKYKDGEPFANYDIYESDDSQIALMYHTIQAENAYGLKGGPREDCIWSFDLQFLYNFTFGNYSMYFLFAVSNYLDIATELSEDEFSSDRSALELVFPPMFTFKISLTF